VKSILGVGPKVKESIKNPFRWKIWLVNVLVGLHVRVKRYDYCIGLCEYECLITSFVLDSEFPKFDCPGMVFFSP